MAHLKPIWSLGRNLFAVAVFVVIGFGAVWVERRLLGSSAQMEPVAFLACVIATTIALRLRARPAAFFIVGSAAWRLTMFFIRNVYGMQWASTEAQFAAMVAGLVGVVFGAALMATTGFGRLHRWLPIGHFTRSNAPPPPPNLNASRSSDSAPPTFAPLLP